MMLSGNTIYDFMEKDEIEIRGSEHHITQSNNLKRAVKTFESWRMTRIVKRSHELNVYKSIDEMETPGAVLIYSTKAKTPPLSGPETKISFPSDTGLNTYHRRGRRTLRAASQANTHAHMT